MKPNIRYPFLGKFPVTFKFREAPDWYVKVVGYPHNGLDFGMPIGTPIVSCEKGKIWYADNVPDADGIGINIGHEWGMSQYWHLKECRAKYGDEVDRGSVIGLSGDTGFATGPHLHFGIKVKGDSLPGMRGWTDPIKYLNELPYQPELPTIEPRTYFVRPGDTLWSIAEKFYGKGYYWTRIYAVNRDKIKTPSLIFPFQRILIP